ncbi:hypothetical protein JEK36_22495 [Klebsiella pneumoniae]|uniref:hypothetical protein n=1 Tax=Klebsiella pneumoniae TaxID=573 RepID=UPI0020447FC2|nr:hypothetical protein [Klebsiella pneumoniae]MCM2595206.1 hypothetical protein [Klebsiella pneumoniae]MCQ8496912.1 hypothetical protein [Klebsiella pneumoniae]
MRSINKLLQGGHLKVAGFTGRIFLSLGLAALVSSCMQSAHIASQEYRILTPDFQDTFDIAPQPANSANKVIKLWSTNYHTHQPEPDSNGVPFRDKNGVAISDKVSKRGWCHGAEEGAVKTTFQGKVVMLTHAGVLKNTPSYAVDCVEIFDNPDLKYDRIYHELTTTPYGFGQNDWFLVPYRTLAVQTTGKNAVLGLKLGDVIFIERLKGTPVYDPVTGKQFRHDGYLFVGDRGSPTKIIGSHVDTFCGFLPYCMSSFTGSSDDHIVWFDAQVITDPVIKSKLKRMHLKTSYR